VIVLLGLIECEERKTLTGLLRVIGESVHTQPKGRAMGGLGRHYSNTEKQVVSGHCWFSGLYVLLGERCPLEPRLYCQKQVYEEEGRCFQNKIAMTVAEITGFEPVPNTHTHVLVDSWYHCRRVRREATARGWEFSGGLKSTRGMRLVQEDNRRHWLKLSAYAATLTRDNWVEVVGSPPTAGRRCTPIWSRLGYANWGPH
jgi:hypothetical protein